LNKKNDKNMKIYININYYLNDIWNLNLCYMIFLNELHDFFQRYWFVIWRYIKWLKNKLWRIEFIEIEFEEKKSKRIKIILNFIKIKLILINEN